MGRGFGLAVLCVATTVWAGPKPKEDAAATFQQGAEAYGAGRYLEAAAKFEAAYALDPDPAYLFNIAQAYRLAQSCKRAVKYYDRFTAAVPNPPDPEALGRYRREAEVCAANPAPQTPATRVVERPVPRIRRWTTWVVPAGISAGVALGFGIDGVLAHRRRDTIISDSGANRFQDAKDEDARYHRDFLVLDVALVATGAFAVTAVVMMSTEPSTFVVVPVVGAEQVGLSISGRL